MGTLIGWTCNECGAGESFFCGGGIKGFDEQEIVERARKGAYGATIATLLESGIPEGWIAFRENAFYACPDCGSIIAGETLTIDDASGGWFVYHVRPDACAQCGYELVLWDEKVPLTERELMARCEGRTEHGCPHCGSTNVSVSGGQWD